MVRPRAPWDRPRECDYAVLLAAADVPRRREFKDALLQCVGRERARALGRYPRFRVVTASSAGETVRRAGPRVSVAAVDLAIPGGRGLETIRQLRATRPALAILAFGTAATASDAIAAVMSGADFFHQCSEDSKGFVRALELALDRRRLTFAIEKSEAEVEAARSRLAQLSGELVRSVPGFRALHAREDVVPFHEAARRYLLAAAQLFASDPRGLARALGVSYFALRRLLARYDVPFPTARPRR